MFESGVSVSWALSRNEVSTSQGETRGRRVADRQPNKSVHTKRLTSTGYPDLTTMSSPLQKRGIASSI